MQSSKILGIHVKHFSIFILLNILSSINNNVVWNRFSRNFLTNFKLLKRLYFHFNVVFYSIQVGGFDFRYARKMNSISWIWKVSTIYNINRDFWRTLNHTDDSFFTDEKLHWIEVRKMLRTSCSVNLYEFLKAFIKYNKPCINFSRKTQI